MPNGFEHVQLPFALHYIAIYCCVWRQSAPVLGARSQQQLIYTSITEFMHENLIKKNISAITLHQHNHICISIMSTLNVNEAKVLNAKFAVSIDSAQKLVSGWMSDSDGDSDPGGADEDAQKLLVKQLQPVASWAGVGSKIGTAPGGGRVTKPDTSKMSASMKALSKMHSKGSQANAVATVTPVMRQDYVVKKHADDKNKKDESDSDEEDIKSRSKKSAKTTGNFLDEYKKTKKKRR